VMVERPELGLELFVNAPCPKLVHSCVGMALAGDLHVARQWLHTIVARDSAGLAVFQVMRLRLIGRQDDDHRERDAVAPSQRVHLVQQTLGYDPLLCLPWPSSGFDPAPHQTVGDHRVALQREVGVADRRMPP
jgi:hypothetical protein